MPWTVDDVDQHIKGLTADQKKVWVKTANGVRDKCIADGKSEKTCDKSAIMLANTAAKRASEAVTKTEDGEDYPASAYAYVPDPKSPSTWKLRLWEDPSKKETAAQVGRAIAALGKGYRGNKVQIPSSDLASVKSKVRAAWNRVNPDANPDDMPDVIKAANDGKWDSGKHYLVKLKRKLMEWVKDRRSITAEDVDSIVRWARASTGGTAKARSNTAEQFAEKTSDSLWVGYWLKSEDADALAIPEGESAQDLHLTLAFLGDMADLPEDAVARVTTAMQAVSYSKGPVDVDVAGVGRFEADDAGGTEDVLYATVEGKDYGFDDLCSSIANAIVATGIYPNRMGEEYIPHVTLMYMAPGADAPSMVPPNMVLTIDTITVAAGADRTAIPLVGLPQTDTSYSVMPNPMYPDSYVELADVCSSSGTERLFIDAKAFSHTPGWIAILPRPGTYQHPQWGEIVITRERNARFVQNFNDCVYQKHIPVDAEHETKLSGALGYIEELVLTPDGSVEARIDWTDRGKSLIASDRFRYVSPEWYDTWSDPATKEEFRDVLIGVALCTRPFFKEKWLRPLVASERGLFTPVVYDSEGEMPDNPKGKETDHDTDLKSAYERQQTELESYKAAAEQTSTELKKATERIEAMESAARKRLFTDVVMGRADTGAAVRFHGDVEKHVAMLEKLAKAFGEDSEEVKQYVDHNRMVAEQIQKGKLFEEKGTSRPSDGAENATDTIMSKATKMAEEKKISLTEAISLVVKGDPDAYASHRDSVTVKV